MFITLGCFEVFLSVIILLTTHMLEHKFRVIKESLKIYASRRNYKTKADISFIENILNAYNKREQGIQYDIMCAVRKNLQQERVGQFSYMSVTNLATKTVSLMWGILVIEALVLWVNQVDMISLYRMGLVGGSLLLTVIMKIYSLLKGVQGKESLLINEVADYVINVYPRLKRQQLYMSDEEEDNKEKRLLDHNRKLKEDKHILIKDEDGERDRKKEEHQKTTELNAQDIERLLQKL